MTSAYSSIAIEKIAVYVFRVPVTQPVETSFGRMRDRPAVFLSLTDSEGCTGWGEVFANWPAAGAEHRAHLIIEDLSALVFEKRYSHPSDLFHWLTQKTHICALQSGEWGPFRQCIAGLDIALYDIFARTEGVSLAQFLTNSPASKVKTYASGIDIRRSFDLLATLRSLGFRSFKVKVGFDLAQDIVQIGALSQSLLPAEHLSADANQAWSLDEAISFCDALGDIPIRWLEEPMPADSSMASWSSLATQFPRVGLAGGENIIGFSKFEEAIKSGCFKVIQPDVIKWGGLTGCFKVARQILDAGLLYCPHFLGGGIGLTASAHLLAAVSSEGLLEWDINPNPLREAFFPQNFLNSQGDFEISNKPGLGIESLPDEIKRFCSFEQVITAN
jgi:D-galactarolactone cycloisomerase